MKLFANCHKEFRPEAVENLTADERAHVWAYIVNENFPKDYSRFTGLVSHVREFGLPNYNPRYQQKAYFEYGAIAHVYMNSSLQDKYVGTLHSDIVFEEGSVNEILEGFDRNPNTIFYQTFFGPQLHPETLHPLYLTPAEATRIGNYLAMMTGVPIDVPRVLREGWIGGMAVAPLDVFLSFGEFLENYSPELEEIVEKDKWHLQTWPGKHTICGIIERMWGMFLMSLGMQLRPMGVRHEQNKYQHDHK